jgi:hypothetical protein
MLFDDRCDESRCFAGQGWHNRRQHVIKIQMSSFCLRWNGVLLDWQRRSWNVTGMSQPAELMSLISTDQTRYFCISTDLSEHAIHGQKSTRTILITGTNQRGLWLVVIWYNLRCSQRTWLWKAWVCLRMLFTQSWRSLGKLFTTCISCSLKSYLRPFVRF